MAAINNVKLEIDSVKAHSGSLDSADRFVTVMEVRNLAAKVPLSLTD